MIILPDPSTHHPGRAPRPQPGVAPGRPGPCLGRRGGDVPPPVYYGTTRPEGFTVKLWVLIKPHSQLPQLSVTFVVCNRGNAS